MDRVETVDGARGQQPRGGWHRAEWGCEFAGTALVLLADLSAVCLDSGPNSPVKRVLPDHSPRLLPTGLFRDLVTLPAKLFHDPSYRSTLGSLLPVRGGAVDRRTTSSVASSR